MAETSSWQVILKPGGHHAGRPWGRPAQWFYSRTAFPDDQSGKASIAFPSKGTELDQKGKKSY